MNDIPTEDLGRLAYQEYGKAVGFRNFQGDPMPEWRSLSDPVKRAWGEAARAVAAQVIMVSVSAVSTGNSPASKVQNF